MLVHTYSPSLGYLERPHLKKKVKKRVLLI